MSVGVSLKDGKAVLCFTDRQDITRLDEIEEAEPVVKAAIEALTSKATEMAALLKSVVGQQELLDKEGRGWAIGGVGRKAREILEREP